MGKQFVTADQHKGHENIIRYCGRPFKDCDEMDETIEKNHNARVKDGDTVYVLGDFCFRNSPGGKVGEGKAARSGEYRKRLNGDIIFIKGNHDRNNSTKTIIEKIHVNYGGWRICMVHNPMHVDYNCEYNFCGHVHERWKFKKLEKDGKTTWVANVGVDVNEFMPKTIEEIMTGLNRWRKIEVQTNLKEVKQNAENNSATG